MKYEVKAKDPENHTYGIWNNDMLAFQFIGDWNGTETISLEEANIKADKLNKKLSIKGIPLIKLSDIAEVNSFNPRNLHPSAIDDLVKQIKNSPLDKMINIDYQFDPENYGFKHISNFPELSGIFGSTTYIKVLASGDKKTYGRVVYWYKACYKCPMDGDDRWKFMSSSYSADRPNDYKSMHDCYLGLISSDAFAKELLCHLFGTTKNKSVYNDGLERLTTNIEIDY